MLSSLDAFAAASEWGKEREGEDGWTTQSPVEALERLPLVRQKLPAQCTSWITLLGHPGRPLRNDASHCATLYITLRRQSSTNTMTT